MKLFYGLLYGIGDVVCGTPCLRALRTAYSQAEIHVMLGRGNEVVLEGLGLVDKVLPYRSGDLSGSKIAKFIKELRSEKYDLMLCTAQTTTWKMPFLTWLAGAKRRVGNQGEPGSFFYTDRLAIDWKKHYVQRELQLLEPLGIPLPTEPRVEVGLVASESSWAQSFFAEKGWTRSRVLGVCSGADPARRGAWIPDLKRWPDASWKKLVQLAVNEGWKVVVFGAPYEQPFAQELARLSPENVFSGAGVWSLARSLAVLKECSALVANDTGLSHAAAGLQIPVVALHAPTDPDLCGPWRAKGAVLCGVLPCAPCFPSPTCGKETCDAMAGISPESVWSQLTLLSLTS